MNFSYDPLPARVLFGVGKRGEVSAEVHRLNRRRALIITTPSQEKLAHEIRAALGERCVGIHDGAVQHVPYHSIATTLEIVSDKAADLLIALGGGSTIGLAKGVALETGLPILAIPTTYAGSEMTHIWGISREGNKRTGRDPIVKPKTVIYDPELVVSLPPALSLVSGVNAMAHAVEALYAENANPIASLMAEESIRALGVGLPKVVAQPDDIDARTQTLYGAWLAATVLDQVGMALHHKLCHTLGGSFNMPHAQTHTVILPYATAYNASHAPDAMAAIGRALDCDPADAPKAIQDISRNGGGPVSLKELGFDAADLDRAAEIAVQNPYYNPRPVTCDGVRALLDAAFHGEHP